MSRMVALVTLGGTIATLSASAPEPVLDGKALCALARIPVDDVAFTDLRLARGSRLDVSDLDALLVTVHGLVADPHVAGVVVTTGSVTLEELAFLMAVSVPSTKPIVVTGATRNADEPEWDGGTNLHTAFAAARAVVLERAGVTVAFDGELHSALVARKVPRGLGVGFESPDVGPVAVVENETVTVRRRIPPVDGLGTARLGRREVPIWYVGAADSGLALRSIAASVDGLVLVGFPHLEIGLPAPVLRVAREVADRGVPVVYTSRFGRLSRRQVAGEEPSFLVVSSLSPAKARLAVMAAPSTAAGRARLQSLFEQIDEAVAQPAQGAGTAGTSQRQG